MLPDWRLTRVRAVAARVAPPIAMDSTANRSLLGVVSPICSRVGTPVSSSLLKAGRESESAL